MAPVYDKNFSSKWKNTASKQPSFTKNLLPFITELGIKMSKGIRRIVNSESRDCAPSKHHTALGYRVSHLNLRWGLAPRYHYKKKIVRVSAYPIL